VSKKGYVGRGEVLADSATRIERFRIATGKPLDECDLTESTRRCIDDSQRQPEDELAEYAVGVNWLGSTDEEGGMRRDGIFTSPMTACRLTHGETLAFLEEQLPDGRHIESTVTRCVSPTADLFLPKGTKARVRRISVEGTWSEVAGWADVVVKLVAHLTPGGRLPEEPPKDDRLHRDAGEDKKRLRLANGWFLQTMYWQPSMTVKCVQAVVAAAGIPVEAVKMEYQLPRSEAQASEAPAGADSQNSSG
jgi:hypothetical protein